MSSAAVRVPAVQSPPARGRVRVALRAGAVAVAATAAVASCAPPSGSGSTVVDVARQQIGKPYVYGGSGPNSFDCSGLTSYAYRAIGKSLPRTADGQYAATYHIPASQAQPGDLVFTAPYGSHVGIWVSPGQMIDAGNPRAGISQRAMWTSYVIGRVP
jgi:cell wall-associated NlpC family hydrolase